MVGVIATPLLFIAGAGAALFGTLGVTGKQKNFFNHVDFVLGWTQLNSDDLLIFNFLFILFYFNKYYLIYNFPYYYSTSMIMRQNKIG